MRYRGTNAQVNEQITRNRKARCNEDGNNKKTLKIYYTNGRSIRNKIDLLRALASEENFDIIAITESWLDLAGNHFKPEVEIEGFNMFHTDRNRKRGGGVIIYIKDNLQCCVNSTIKLDDNTESLWLNVKEGKNKLVIGLLYRPPNLSKEASNLLWQEIERACRSKHVCIMGDFNYRNIDWEALVGDQEAEEFLNVVQDNFLRQIINEPTRGNNILDLVLTNREEVIKDTEIGGNLGNSDHCEIRFKMKWNGIDSSMNNVKIPDFRRANYNGLRTYLEAVVQKPGNEINSGIDSMISVSGDNNHQEEEITIEEEYERIIEQLITGQMINIPYKEIRTKNNDPKWMTDKIKHYIGIKKGIYRKIKNGEDHLRQRYNELARDVKKLVRVARRNYEIKVANRAKEDPKSFYQLYKTKVRDKIGPLIDSNGELVSDRDSMAGMLNDFFLSVFTQEDTLNIPEVSMIFRGNDEEKLKDILITKEIVTKEIDKIKSSKAPGPDEVFPRILKECKDVLSEPLACIFRKSLESGIVPVAWKKANVIPIFKKGDKTNMSNYRPVSLTSVVGKMMESIIARNIRDHLDKHKLIKESQHGFSKGKSCLTNLLSFYSKVYEAADNDENYDILYLDFSKAFDRVPHLRLLSKVKAHGIDGSIFRWIQSWLGDRQQRVSIDGVKSEWGCVSSGVPQGSVLGPLLFLIYINDLDIGISSDLSKFADDTKLGRAIRADSDAVVMQEELTILSNWAEKWQMKFNIDKCSVLSIGRNNPLNSYKLNGRILGRTDCERDLGILVSSDLRPRKQCLNAKNKANRILGFIRRSVSNKSAEVILKLYLALVRPHLDYAVQFWSPYYRKDIDLLESVQRRMTKMIGGLRNLPYGERLRKLNLHTLERRRVRGELIEVFKWVKGYNKGDLGKVLILSEHDRTRSNGFKLDKYRFRKEIGRNWFTNRVVDEWNRLTRHVIEASSLGSFKNRLDKYMNEAARWD